MKQEAPTSIGRGSSLIKHNTLSAEEFVLPEYQGKGIGRMLIKELLSFIEENGVPETNIFVELCAMPDKIPFYEKFGFSANEAQRLRIMYQVHG